MDNFITGHPDNIAHLFGRGDFSFVRQLIEGDHIPDDVLLRPARRHQLHLRGGRAGRGAALRLARLAGGLPGAAHPHAEGGVAGHPQGAGAGQGQGGALPPGLDQRGVRRPAGASAAGKLLGAREPGGPARGVRRGQALRRGHDHGVPPLPRGAHAHRTHLQHLRPADAPGRRARGVQLHRAGAARRAHLGVRRRLADALVLLRGRPGGGDLPPLPFRPGGADQHRQPRREGLRRTIPHFRTLVERDDLSARTL